MIVRFETLRRRARTFFSHGWWGVRILRRSCPVGVAGKPGMIVLQIDGLSHRQFRRALAEGRLPFLKSLIDKQKFVAKPFYSGMPSATPAVQAELFHGVKTAVPSFHYVHRATGRQCVMYEAECAEEVVARLAGQGEPLLRDGTAYSDIFSGGAPETHFCIEGLSPQSLFREFRRRRLLLLALIHLGKLLRIAGLGILEFLLAIVDFCRGLIARHDLGRELKFVFTRVGVCIVLRELIRFHVKMDIVRGVKIIHANFVGYDEQAHRRGPSSYFAHWALKGIDGTIRDIYRSARAANCRDYRMAIYADHGQESAISDGDLHETPLHLRIMEVFAVGPLAEFSRDLLAWEGPLAYLYRRGRAMLLKSADGSGGAGRAEAEGEGEEEESTAGRIVLTAMGPLGHIYLPKPLSLPDKLMYARQLVARADIPLVLFADGHRVYGVNRLGTFDLLEGEAELLGGDHPFLLEVAADLHGLCRHADSGDFVISGWQPGCRPITFAAENGAHGGPGCEETRGFVLLPPDLAGSLPYLRPMDLGRKIRWGLEARLSNRGPRPGSLEENPSIRVVTYNVHSCLTLDGHLAPHRIARVLHNLRPDIVALQEVDQGMERTRGQDQAAIIALDLEMHSLFFPVLAMDGGHYGLAVLSRFPLREVKYGFLSRGSAHAGRERRGFMWVEVEGPAGRLHLLNTHLGLTPAERRLQGEALLATLRPAGNRPMIVCADLNAGPRSPIYRNLATRLTDVSMAGTVARSGREPATFPANYPFLRLDYIFVSSHFETLRATISDQDEARKASDHLPVVADVRFRGG